jgi:hypothetical protein
MGSFFDKSKKMLYNKFCCFFEVDCYFKRIIIIKLQQGKNVCNTIDTLQNGIP